MLFSPSIFYYHYQMLCPVCFSENECSCLTEGTLTVKKRKDRISDYYDPLLDGGVEEYEKLGWESAGAQRRRFDVMLDGIGFDGMSILDVGCGLGSLLEALKSRGWESGYWGVDILPEMVEEARLKHPDQDWLCTDLFADNPFEKKSFDVVYASGIFNLDLGNNIDFLKEALNCFAGLSRSHICFNLLSDSSRDKEEGYFYYREDEVRRLVAEELSALSIRVEHSYLPNDMTVIITLD